MRSLFMRQQRVEKKDSRNNGRNESGFVRKIHEERKRVKDEVPPFSRAPESYLIARGESDRLFLSLVYILLLSTTLSIFG